MLSIVEWGHSRLEYEENPKMFEDEDHMNYVGEFYFKVNETCLHGGHNIFMVAPNDRDAHNPILVHLNPSDFTCMKIKRKQQRKETQRQNKRKGYEDQAWSDHRSTGYGRSSASSSGSWRTGYWR